MTLQTASMKDATIRFGLPSKLDSVVIQGYCLSTFGDEVQRKGKWTEQAGVDEHEIYTGEETVSNLSLNTNYLTELLVVFVSFFRHIPEYNLAYAWIASFQILSIFFL
jgi:hypothetical protein